MYLRQIGDLAHQASPLSIAKNMQEIETTHLAFSEYDITFSKGEKQTREHQLSLYGVSKKQQKQVLEEVKKRNLKECRVSLINFIKIMRNFGRLQELETLLKPTVAETIASFEDDAKKRVR